LLAVSVVPAEPWDVVDQAGARHRDVQARTVASRHRIPIGPSDQRTADILYRRLVELVDDRLLAEHRITRASAPDEAKTILGSELASFVDDPGASRSLTDLRVIDRVVSRIERL
jgi:hypothetical protein